MNAVSGAAGRELTQGSLFPPENISQSGANGNGSAFHDPAFAGNKTRPVHRWVPWIAGFSGAFVAGTLTKYLHGKGTVLDPFAGVGTTLVEAVLHGHDAVGFEINPYAALACRLKARAYCLSAQNIRAEMLRLQEFYTESMASGYVSNSQPPAGFKTRAAFYSPKVLQKVLIVQDFIAAISNPQVRELFRLAFASTMVRFSNYSYEPSLGQRKSAGKEDIPDFPVAQAVLGKLAEMVEDIGWLQRALPPEARPQAHVINDTFFRHERYLARDSIDLIVTSPPYLNNYHYNRNTRPQLYWLGYAEQPEDMRALEEANFGRYWQTVRAGKRIDLEFSLPRSDLAERLASIRLLHPEKGVYGGCGWANYAASYFNDCRRCALGIVHALKPGGTALVVIGNSILQGVHIPTDEYFGQIAESVGLTLASIDIPRDTRVGNSIIQSDVRVARAQNRHKLYEAVVEIRKPG